MYGSIFIVLFAVIFVQLLIIKSQDKRISDLLDRIMAPDYKSYSDRKERENRKLEVVEAEKLINKLTENEDGLRIY